MKPAERKLRRTFFAPFARATGFFVNQNIQIIRLLRGAFCIAYKSAIQKGRWQMYTESQDAYGHEIHDHHLGKPAQELVERDDGFLDISSGPQSYFAPFNKWPEYERKAIRFAEGRVLDVGCGAGRVALYLQEKGQDCVGIDVSPLAIKVCRERGVKDARVVPITRVGAQLGTFDSVVMYGNNFGLFGSKKRADWLLQKFYHITKDSGRIIAETMDPYDTTDPSHLMYQKFNLRRGRMAGQIRIRVRYKKYETPWFDYLLVSRDEMKQLLQGSGWKVTKFVDSGSRYIAIIEKE